MSRNNWCRRSVFRQQLGGTSICWHWPFLAPVQAFSKSSASVFSAFLIIIFLFLPDADESTCAVIGMNSPLPFVPRGAKARGMARHHSPRHPLFRQRWFADDIIITCVRWYLRFKLSYRELAELARELGVSVAPSTVLRWVVRYVPEFEKCWQAYERPVGDSWRVDETYLKVGGQWVYLYRSVDKQGKTVES
jgi:hypothetical protein